jgi:RimJ/RimL family protein N-acetyltransferase
MPTIDSSDSHSRACTEAVHPRVAVLNTDRLLLTTWSLADLPDLQALHGNSEAMKHMASGVQDLRQTRARLRTWQAEHAEQGWSKWRVQQLDGAFVGRAGFSRAHGTNHREVGFLLAPQYWGRVLATELLRALTSWHHDSGDATLSTDLLAYAFAANTGSRRVLEKAGFELIGTDSSDPSQLVYRHR